MSLYILIGWKKFSAQCESTNQSTCRWLSYWVNARPWNIYILLLVVYAYMLSESLVYFCTNASVIVVTIILLQALRLSHKSRRTYTVGDIVNLMSVDVQRLMDVTYYLHMLWSSPLQILLALGFLYQTMGPSIFAGFGLMVLLIPLNVVIASFSKKFQVNC